MGSNFSYFSPNPNCNRRSSYRFSHLALFQCFFFFTSKNFGGKCLGIGLWQAIFWTIRKDTVKKQWSNVSTAFTKQWWNLGAIVTITTGLVYTTYVLGMILKSKGFKLNNNSVTTVYNDIYLAKGFSKLQSPLQTINIWSASFARVWGRFPWKTLKSFNFFMALFTWIRTLAIWRVDFVAARESSFPEKI